MNIDERVYGYEPAASQLKELRNEIERLNKRVRDIETERRNLRAAMNLREEDHQRKTAEIERLRSSLKKEQGRYSMRLSIKEAEIERLNTNYELLSDDYKQLQGDNERLRDQVTRLSTLVDTERSLHDTEIERLRTALVADDDGSTAYQSGYHARDAEVEQLRKYFTDLLRLVANDAFQYQSKIERLRQETLVQSECIETLRKELAEKDNYIRTVSRPLGAHSYE